VPERVVAARRKLPSRFPRIIGHARGAAEPRLAHPQLDLVTASSAWRKVGKPSAGPPRAVPVAVPFQSRSPEAPSDEPRLEDRKGTARAMANRTRPSVVRSRLGPAQNQFPICPLWWAWLCKCWGPGPERALAGASANQSHVLGPGRLTGLVPFGTGGTRKVGGK